MSTKVFQTQLELQNNSALATPSTGFLTLAPKSDNKVYIRTSAGVEKQLLTTDDSTTYLHPTGFTNQPSTPLANNIVISQVNVNNEGHITGVTTRALSVADIHAMPEMELSGQDIIGSEFGGSPEKILLDTSSFIIDGGTLKLVGGGGSGTVTSVGLSMPSIFSVTGSPVTTSGTLTASLVGQTRNKVLASATSGAGTTTPTFRLLDYNDLPDLTGMFDNYVGWKVRAGAGNATNEAFIYSANGSYIPSTYNAIHFLQGNNMTITPSGGVNQGYLNLTFDVTGMPINNTASQTTLASNCTLNVSSWTSITSITLPSAGTYDVRAKIFVSQAGTSSSIYRLAIGTTYYDYVSLNGSSVSSYGTTYLQAVITTAGSATLTLQGYTGQANICAVASTTLGGVTASGLTKLSYIKVA